MHIFSGSHTITQSISYLRHRIKLRYKLELLDLVTFTRELLDLVRISSCVQLHSALTNM